MVKFIRAFLSIVVSALLMTGIYYMAFAIFMTLFPKANTFVVNMGMIFSVLFILIMTIFNKIEKLYELIEYHDIQKEIKKHHEDQQDRIKSLIDILNK